MVLQTLLVGVNTKQGGDHVVNALYDFETKAELNGFMKIEEATPAKMAKFGGWISKSIVVQSQSLGSGGSTPI